MKKKICLLALISIYSCGLGPKKIDGFDNYKKVIILNNSIFPLKTNGIYVSINEGNSLKGIKGFYLYKNGIYHYEYFDDNFWLSPEKELKKRSSYYENSNDFGEYIIRKDTIIIQDFYSNNNEFYSKKILEYKDVILSDTIVKILSSYTLNKEELLGEPIIYRFYPISKKPDSTKAWFLDRKWYKKGLHKSRK
ncbi:hypothetical protein [Flavobacterium sp. CLA17]|uniref:hypothetical protein n=1 Tax=Flavobacterium sp. CLA17 TaxID=2724135 RepID=UPI0014912E91|nr:hypothetical protein [Flavobacterium sp. CLA17]QSB26510.1 hypothetical protein HAV12_019415 [Flavobacterium sp. CLA17]